MASNSGVQQHYHQSNSSPHHCKECGLYLNSAESLEVHLQYHKENLLNKWATQAASSHSEETNNNNPKAPTIKREFIPNSTVSAPADSSDSMLKKSPDYASRATPETSVNFGHPPTPQSYHSASSPYQNPDNSTFSPGFQTYQSVKTERSSPHFQQQPYPSYSDGQFFGMDSGQNYSQDYPMHKMLQSQQQQQQQNAFRYHPYQQQQQNTYERNSQPQVTSSSPAYPPQPTPSPSPKQCDKCGYVCESASQLFEHLNVAHPPTPAPHLSYQQNQHFMFGNQPPEVKVEEDAQSEILDLDSHKVHQVYQEEDKARQNGEVNGHNPHSVSAMLSSWPHHKFPPQEPQRMFINTEQQQKMYQNGIPNSMNQKMFQHQEEQSKMFPAHDFIANGVTTSAQQDNPAAQNYRPFEHMQGQPATPVITSTQVPNPQPPSGASAPAKGANWKSNEARRPKTYNCTACNKWFTSSGHLKRHYNTTLHKNAVKSSGQPDPASLPISAHHHPGRESASSRSDSSPGPLDDSRGDDSLPGLLQQPPNGPYDRQPAPNIHNSLHSPMGGHGPNPNLSNHSSLSNLSGSPPNGEAGPSATASLDSRGLLLSNTTPNSFPTPPAFGMAAPMMPMEGAQFQMYPNGSAPHVTQHMVTNSLSTTGELVVPDTQPLPSFAQFQTHRYGLLLSYGSANVGGLGPVTAPSYSFYPENDVVDSRPVLYKHDDDDDYKITVLTVDHNIHPTIIGPYSPPNHNNNNNNDSLSELHTIPDENAKYNPIDDIKIKYENQPPSPEKIQIKRDYEESTGSPLISSTVQVKQNGVHKCFDCDKMFNKACYLTQHNKTFHSGDRPFKCTRCGKRFSCENQYQEHLTKHAGEKPFKCDLCPKQFNHKTDLRRHMCLHTGQKPYACDTCGKGFIRKDHMLKHFDTHSKKPHSAKLAAVR